MGITHISSVLAIQTVAFGTDSHTPVGKPFSQDDRTRRCNSYLLKDAAVSGYVLKLRCRRSNMVMNSSTSSR